jgi:hypothetical protein
MASQPILWPEREGAGQQPEKARASNRTSSACAPVGDVLACDARLRTAVSTGFESGADFFYGDERQISAISREVEPFFTLSRNGPPTC